MPIIYPSTLGRSRVGAKARTAPADAGVLLAEARAALDRRDFATADRLYREVLELEPRNVQALRGRGYAALQGNRLAEALADLEAALALAPDDPQVNHAFAHVCLRLAEPELAEEHFRRVLGVLPASEAAVSGLATALVARGRGPEAIAMLTDLVTRQPASTVGWLSLGITHERVGHDGEALACFERLVATDPDDHDARYHRSLIELRQGDFAIGWSDYEQRFAAGVESLPRFACPRWSGQRVRRLLVAAEQGLGDVVHFSRFLPMLAHECGEVIFACPAPLMGLLRRSFPEVRVVDADAPPPPCDAFLPLMSAPGALRLAGASTRDAGRYLAIDPERVAVWRERIGAASPGSVRVGLTWSASIGHATESNPYTRRSCPLGAFASLASVPGVRLFGLQLGPAQREAARAGFALTDLSPGIRDFDDTAAIAEVLDAIVSVDTSVAHVSAALGRPTRLVLPYAPNWQWMTDAARTPWYPAIRMFRQHTPGDWAAPVSALAAALAGPAGGRSRPE